jgi:leader peptidase (prepilin peptidase) / N-methyltransferase
MNLVAFADRHSLTIFTAMLFGLAVWRLGLAAELPAVWVFIFGGVLLSVIDWKVQRLPTNLLYYTFAGVVACLVLAAVIERELSPLVSAGTGSLLFGGVFFVVHFLGRTVTGLTVIGLGDVRLAFMLGALLGWYGLRYVYYGAAAGNLLVLLVVGAMYLRDRTLRGRYPFGPSLIAGTLAVILVHG